MVIPAWNAAPYIGDALQGVAAQTRPADQVIVVDDGSTDDTAGAAKIAADALGLTIEVIRQGNAGVAAARNAGLVRATTDLVALLDGDDVWLPQLLATLLPAFDAPDVVLAFGDEEAFDERGVVWPSLLAGKRLDELPWHEVVPGGLRRADGSLFVTLTTGNYIPMSAVLLRKQAVLAAGGFDPSLRICEDRDFFLRLSRRGAAVCTGQRLARKRLHGASLTGSRAGRLALQQHAVRILARLAAGGPPIDPPLDEAERRAVIAALRDGVDELLDVASAMGWRDYRAARRMAAGITGAKPPWSARPLLRATAASLGIGRG